MADTKANGIPRLKLGFHKFYTYFLLPVLVAFGIVVSLGKVMDFTRLSLETPLEALDAVRLVFPFICTILNFLALVGLLGFSRFGRKATMFNATLTILFSLLCLVTNLMEDGDLYKNLVYLALIAAYGFLYSYYLRRGRYFPKGGSTWKKTKEMHELFYTKPGMPETAAVQEPKEEAGTEEKAGKPAEETPAEEEKPEEPAPEEPQEEKEAEPVLPVVRSRTLPEGLTGIQKMCRISIGTFVPEEPLWVSDIRLTLVEGMTLIDFTVVNRGNIEYASSEWLVNGKYTYTCGCFFPTGESATVKAELTESVDRVKLVLLAATDIYGRRTEYSADLNKEVTIPEKRELGRLTDEEGFDAFLPRYVGSTFLNARYAAETNRNGIILCPVCGNPMKQGEKYCPVCGIPEEDILHFTPENVLKAFHSPSLPAEPEEDQTL